MDSKQSTKFLALTIAAIFIVGAITIPLTIGQTQAATKKATVNIVIQGGKEGKQGQKGEKGDPGSPGVAGAPGEKGETGAQGETGATGATGDPGPRGEAGVTGETGPAGEAGPPGTVTINLCQANQPGCQSIEAEAGDNITIAVNVTGPSGGENETTGGNETQTPIDNGTVVIPPDNGTVVTPPGNDTVIVPPSNGTVIVPPANGTITPPDNGTVITPPDNETTTTPNGTGPIQCQPGTHEEGGQCVVDTGFPPTNTTTEGNITSGNLTG